MSQSLVIILLLLPLIAPLILIWVLLRVIRKRRGREALSVAEKQSHILEPAGFWIRSTALFIDGLILGFFFQIPMSFLISHSFDETHAPRATAFLAVATTLLSVVYYVYFLSSRHQATPGKIIMKIYVISTEAENRLNPAQALWRWVVFTGPAIIWMIAPAFGELPEMKLPDNYQVSIQHVLEIEEKKSKGEAVSSEDRQRAEQFNEKMAENAKVILFSKSFWAMQFAGMICGLYSLMIGCTVAFTHNKLGFHDSLCRTRVVRGRAPSV